MKLQQAFLHPRLQVDADGTHVAHDLVGRFFEGKIQDTLAATAGGIGKVCDQAALAGARCTGDQHAAAAEIALAAEHLIQARNAAGNTFTGYDVVQARAR